MSTQDASKDTSSKTTRCTETHAEQALRKLLPKAAKFQRLFKEAMEAKESGFVILKVEFDRGIMKQVFVDTRDVSRPIDQNAED